MTSPSHGAESTPEFENRLAGETSPYLLQHRHNPVDWYPWGEEAFARARAEQKPLLISIGYSACHWCHVMERESFEDSAVADLMNAFLICVKVDREERPDVDAIYMDVCQAMTGQGGWPLNVFATPDLKPFFAGTYFPPDTRYGRASWPMVLERVREAWTLDRSALVSQANDLHEELSRLSRLAPRSGQIESDIFERVIDEARRNFDTRHGGFGNAPKFPPDTRLALLLVAHHDLRGEPALEMATRTLDAMAYGGMYDQIGGGFARYSVDAQWLIPHFEKMLYNQALLVPVYADAFLITGKALYRRVVTETLDWVLRDLRSERGAFFCALDADSEGEEGKYYVWTPAQIEEILGRDDAALFCEYYGISASGNFEHGTSNPNIAMPPADFAAAHGMSEEDWLVRVELLKHRVRESRSRRIPPGLDDKCLTGWNGLMITALCRGWQVLGEVRWLDAARSAADFLLEVQWTADPLALKRSWCKGKSSIEGLLDDYAYFANGLIDLYESCFQRRYLDAARALAQAAIDKFEDVTGGGFFYTSGQDGSLITRTREDHDGALPAASSVAALALLRLAAIFGDEALAHAGRRAIEASASQVNRVPQAFASLLLAHRFAAGPTPQIVIASEAAAMDADSAANDLARTAWGTYLPARCIAWSSGGEEGISLIAEKKSLGGQPTAYVCANFSCQTPQTTAAGLKQQLLNEGRPAVGN